MGLGATFFCGLLAFLGYAAFALLLPFLGKRSWPNSLFVIASALTALWAFAVAQQDFGWSGWAWLPRVAGILRDAGWFAVMIAFLRQNDATQNLWRRLGAAAAALIACALGFAITDANFNTGLGLWLNVTVAQFAVSIMGLILVENMTRNLPQQRYWSLKLMAIGLTALFLYNITMSIPEFLTRTSAPLLVIAQPLVYLVVLPLFVVTAVRNDSLGLQIHSSRKVVFHSATLIFAGVLLQGTAAAAYYVRNFGGTPAVLVSIVLGFSGVVGIVVALSSHSLRSQIRAFINENFFSYKYDYRLEWTKFINALSLHEESGGPERVLRTLADLLDSPGGVLWVRRSGWQQFVPLARWSFGESFGPIQATDDLLSAFRDEQVAFLDLRSDDKAADAVLWRKRFPSAWLAVPLRFRGELVGFALLHKPRAMRRLDWEDRNLVALISMQLAAYLVQEHTAQELADSRQLAEFNKRLTFALHDLKNTSGQLNLLLHNIERFGDDEAFRADMMVTIRHAVDNLQGLMAKLKGEDVSTKAKRPTRVDVRELVAQLAAQKIRSGVVFGREKGGEPIYAEIAQPGAFENALEQVIANAVEASPADASVRVSIDRTNDQVRVRVADNGPGMSPEFIAHELFRPLRTTKKKGLGIGAYQARTMMRELGGDIEVESKPGEGTTVSLLLPAAKAIEDRKTQ